MREGGGEGEKGRRGEGLLGGWLQGRGWLQGDGWLRGDGWLQGAVAARSPSAEAAFAALRRTAESVSETPSKRWPPSEHLGSEIRVAEN